MKSFILSNKIKNLAINKIRHVAKEIDNKKKFPNFINSFFSEKDLKLLLGHHTRSKSISSEEEVEFYYYATKYCANIRNYFLPRNLTTILNFMSKDKKNITEKINLILIKKIGSTVINNQYKKSKIKRFLKDSLAN